MVNPKGIAGNAEKEEQKSRRRRRRRGQVDADTWEEERGVFTWRLTQRSTPPPSVVQWRGTPSCRQRLGAGAMSASGLAGLPDTTHLSVLQHLVYTTHLCVGIRPRWSARHNTPLCVTTPGLHNTPLSYNTLSTQHTSLCYNTWSTQHASLSYNTCIHNTPLSYNTCIHNTPLSYNTCYTQHTSLSYNTCIHNTSFFVLQQLVRNAQHISLSDYISSETHPTQVSVRTCQKRHHAPVWPSPCLVWYVLVGNTTV